MKKKGNENKQSNMKENDWLAILNWMMKGGENEDYFMLRSN